MAFNFVRKFLKEFSATNKASRLQVFGSKSSGAPASSADPEVLQSDPNFENGWPGATIFNPGNNTRNPVEDEWNALNYIENYHINYILQKGIPEYNASTTYYIGDICREIGGLKLYQSKTDDNIGNAVTDTVEWLFIPALGVVNRIPINSESDFPTPVAGVITLKNGKTYELQQTIVTANRFEFEAGASLKITSINTNAVLVYIGGGTMFTSADFGIVEFESVIISGAGNGDKMFDISGFGLMLGFKTFFAGSSFGGNMDNALASFIFCDFSDFGQGFTCTDNPFGVAITESSCGDWKNEVGTVMFTFSGTLAQIGLFDSSWSTNSSNETIFNLDESLKESGTLISINTNVMDTRSGGQVFAPNSLEQDYINSTFIANNGIQNSTSLIKLTFAANSAATTITVTGQNEPINTNAPYAISALIERFLIQDIATFTNGTNTINTPSLVHGMVADDRVFLHTYTGTLPAELDSVTEYFIINPNASDFQVSLTQGGAAVAFTDDGSGVLYFRHNTGFSDLGHIVYIGNESIKIKGDGWVAIQGGSPTDIDVRSVVMKIALNGTITEDQPGSKANADNTKPQSSVTPDLLELVTGEGVTIYVRNDLNTDNLIAEDVLTILIKG